MRLEPEPEPDRPFPPLCFLTVPLSRVVQNAQVGFITFANAAERKNEHVLDGWTTKAAYMLQSHTVQPEQVNQEAGQKGVNCSENIPESERWWNQGTQRNWGGGGLQTWQNPFLCICLSRRGTSWISVMDSAILDVEIPSFSHTVPFILNPCSPWKSSQHQARATSPGASFLLLRVLWHGSSDHIRGNCPVLPIILDQWHSPAPSIPTAGTQFLPFFLWLYFCPICSALPHTQPLQRGFLVTLSHTD